jgi:PAS domain S-box-containing protein
MVGMSESAGPITANHGLDLFHPDDRERALTDILGTEIRGDFLENELRFLTRHLGERIFHSRAIAIRDATGKIVRIRGMSQDVTEQRVAEQCLREREALLAAAEQIANIGSYECDASTGVLKLSPNLREIWGVEDDRDDWTMEDCCQHVHPDDRKRLKSLALQAVADRMPFQCTLRYNHPAKSLRYLHVSGLPVADANGEFTRRVGAVRDVTEQHRAEMDLREREELLAAAEEIANFGSYPSDYRTRSTTMSANLRKIYGIAREAQWSRRFFRQRLHPEDRDRVMKIFDGVMKQAKPFQYVARYMRTETDIRILHVRGVPIFDNAGQLIKRTGVVQDITDHARAEQNLRSLSQRLLNTRDEEQRRVARSNGDLVAEIRDYGCGIVLPSRALSAPPMGVGIAGMRERVTQLSGVLKIDTAPGKGTTVRATIPVNRKSEPHAVSTGPR